MTTLRDITFEEFTIATAQIGTAVIEAPHAWFVKNGDIKFEWKRNVITIGYGLGQKGQIEIRQLLEDNGYQLREKQPSQFTNVLYDDDMDDLEYFLEICEFLIEAGITKSTNRRSYSGINEAGLFTNIATVIKAAFDTKMYDMIERKAYDSVDHIVSKNEPLETNSYREHIVPCVMITQHAFEMYDNGASITEVATMIQQNLHIVHITKEQANYIDYTLGLKTTMPDGWKFGDSVFARLDAAGINY